jgi:hypothetical protein
MADEFNRNALARALLEDPPTPHGGLLGPTPQPVNYANPEILQMLIRMLQRPAPDFRQMQTVTQGVRG